MKESPSNAPSEKQSCPRKECILAAKIFDQCRFQDYVRQGPVISAEKCECIILHPEICADGFGGIVLPGKAVRFPKWVKRFAAQTTASKPKESPF